MNRKIFAISCVFIFCSSISNGQGNAVMPQLPINDETKLITYEKVVEVPETKKDDLFERAVQWVNAFYKNPGDVLREKNPNEGKLFIKARFKISNPPDKTGFATDAGVIQYSLTLLFKDNKYKYTLTGINWKQLSYYAVERWMDKNSQTYDPKYPYYLTEVDENARKILADLEQNMAVKKKEKKEDW